MWDACFKNLDKKKPKKTSQLDFFQSCWLYPIEAACPHQKNGNKSSYDNTYLCLLLGGDL